MQGRIGRLTACGPSVDDLSEQKTEKDVRPQLGRQTRQLPLRFEACGKRIARRSETGRAIRQGFGAASSIPAPPARRLRGPTTTPSRSRWACRVDAAPVSRVTKGWSMDTAASSASVLAGLNALAAHSSSNPSLSAKTRKIVPALSPCAQSKMQVR